MDDASTPSELLPGPVLGQKQRDQQQQQDEGQAFSAPRGLRCAICAVPFSAGERGSRIDADVRSTTSSDDGRAAYMARLIVLEAENRARLVAAGEGGGEGEGEGQEEEEDWGGDNDDEEEDPDWEEDEDESEDEYEYDTPDENASEPESDEEDEDEDEDEEEVEEDGDEGGGEGAGEDRNDDEEGIDDDEGKKEDEKEGEEQEGDEQEEVDDDARSTKSAEPSFPARRHSVPLVMADGDTSWCANMQTIAAPHADEGAAGGEEAPAMPYHQPCLDIFKRVAELKYGKDGVGPRVDALVEWWTLHCGDSDYWDAIPRDPAVARLCGAVDLPADQHVTANPVDIPSLAACLAPNSARSGDDCLSRLPADLRSKILPSPDTADADSQRVASPTVGPDYRALVARDAPWVWEARGTADGARGAEEAEGADKEDARDGDWCGVFVRVMRNDIQGLRNRKRVWVECEALLDMLERVGGPERQWGKGEGEEGGGA